MAVVSHSIAIIFLAAAVRPLGDPSGYEACRALFVYMMFCCVCRSSSKRSANMNSHGETMFSSVILTKISETGIGYLVGVGSDNSGFARVRHRTYRKVA